MLSVTARVQRPIPYEDVVLFPPSPLMCQPVDLLANAPAVVLEPVGPDVSSEVTGGSVDSHEGSEKGLTHK